ncbi:MAG: hypothetical protein AB1817_05775 [Chloroflexota bacterium]
MASTISRKRLRGAKHVTRQSQAGTLTAREEHLKDLMKQAVREVLEEQAALGDPDAGLELRPEFVAELEEQERRVAAGERGKPLAQVLRDYGIA